MGEAASPRPDPHGWMRDVFLRLLGAVYLVAFLSFWVQAEGLVGTRGILPIRDLLLLARERLGPSRYWVIPPSSGWETAMWPCTSSARRGRPRRPRAAGPGAAARDAGALGALSLGDRGRRGLPLVPMGRPASGGRAPGRAFWRRGAFSGGGPGPPPLLVVWMYRWLLFRLMFGSGVVKLRSGDSRGGAGARVPLRDAAPADLGRLVRAPPARTYPRVRAAVMFLIELVLPWLIWFPGRWRRLPLVARRVPDADRGHGELRVLQPPHRRPLRVPGRPGLLPPRWRPPRAPKRRTLRPAGRARCWHRCSRCWPSSPWSSSRRPRRGSASRGPRPSSG